MAVLLAREKRIDLNSNLKRQGIKSDQAVVIKKIPIDTPKNMIIIAVSEFGEIKLIKIQLIGMWQKAVVEFAELSQADLLASKWSFLIGKNSVRIAKAFRALLFTLPIEMMVHDLETLLEKSGGKICIINRSLKTGNRIHCAVIGFEFNNNLESTFHIEPIFGRFDHSALECDIPVVFPSGPPRTFKKIASDEHCLQLAKLYEKKGVLISYPIAFGGKFWAQVVSFVGPSNGPHFSSGSSASFPLSDASGSNIGSPLISDNNSSLNAHLAILECSLELLMDRVSGILKKLSDMKLVLMVTFFSVFSLVTSPSLVLHLDVDMTVDDMSLASAPPLSAVDDVIHGFSSSFSKILASKVSKLESKMVSFEVLIGSVLERLDCLCSSAVATCNVRGMNNPAKQENIVRWHKDIDNLVSIFMETKLKNKACPWLVDKFDDVCVFSSGLNSGYVGADVAIVINRFLAKYVYKISENKLLVSILELYAGASLATQFSQANEINSLIAKTINELICC
ncbi:hypothetical protein G9A89_020719 [Geosiphon pyriformis]|nr:hypothetical protein G9A89_020719 [Geosiphon pyriformis]